MLVIIFPGELGGVHGASSPLMVEWGGAVEFYRGDTGRGEGVDERGACRWSLRPGVSTVVQLGLGVARAKLSLGGGR